MKQLVTVVFSGMATLVFSSCNAGKNQTNIELVTAMMDQNSVKFQDWDKSVKGQLAMGTPPENTIPRGYKPYAFKGQPDEAEKNLKNPMGSDFSTETLELGKKKYDIYCGVCHGMAAGGDGPVASKMILKPPPLVGKQAKKMSDGRIFHIITDGQGVMGSYLNQIQEERARWAVVNYLRTLQRRHSAN